MTIAEYKKDFENFLQDTQMQKSKQSKNIYIKLICNKYTINTPTAEQLEQLQKEL